MKKLLYLYEGKYYGVSELSEMTGLTTSAIYKRLKNGWDFGGILTEAVDDATNTVEEQWQGKALRIVFRNPIPEVFDGMQPVIGRIYNAFPNPNSTGHSGGCRQHFLIKLDNGKPLIVYPGEFEIIGEVEE